MRDLRLARHLGIGFGILVLPLAVAAGFAHIDETVTARGRIDFTGLVPVTTRVSARIERVLCREGERVEAGAVLFELDAEELRVRRDQLAERARAIATDHRHLEGLRRLAAEDEHPRDAAHARREVQVAAAEEAMKATIRRTREGLSARQLVSAEETEIARREHEAATARKEAAEAALEALLSRQRRALAELDRALDANRSESGAVAAALPLAERALGDATVRAPIAGSILTPAPERLRGRRCDAGETIVEMAEPRDLHFVMRVDEREISKVAPGQDVIVSLDAFPFYIYRPFRGRTAEISRAPVAKAAAADAAEFRVLVELRDPVLELQVSGERRPVDLRPGLSGEGTIVANRAIGLWTYLFRSLEKRLPKSWTIY